MYLNGSLFIKCVSEFKNDGITKIAKNKNNNNENAPGLKPDNLKNKISRIGAMMIAAKNKDLELRLDFSDFLLSRSEGLYPLLANSF